MRKIISFSSVKGVLYWMRKNQCYLIFTECSLYIGQLRYIKGTVIIFSSDPLWNKGMPDLQRYFVKFWLIILEAKICVCLSLKWWSYCRKLKFGKTKRFSKISHCMQIKKDTSIILSQRCKWYCCESDTTLYTWKITWN